MLATLGGVRAADRVGRVRAAARARGQPSPRQRERARRAAAGRPARGSRATSRRLSSSASASPSASVEVARRARSSVGEVLGVAAARPAQPHSTVRSLSSTWKRHAVVDAVERPSACGSTCPPLRSALLTTASKHGHPAQAGVVGVHERDRPRRRPSASSTREPAGRHGVRAARSRRGRRRASRRRRRTIHSWQARPERARRAAPSAARRPSRRPRRPRTPPPRGRPACRRGSPTAAARRRSACRRSAGSHARRASTRASSVVLRRVDQPALESISPCASSSSSVGLGQVIGDEVSGGSRWPRADVARRGRAAGRRAGTAAGRRDTTRWPAGERPGRRAGQPDPQHVGPVVGLPSSGRAPRPRRSSTTLGPR